MNIEKLTVFNYLGVQTWSVYAYEETRTQVNKASRNMVKDNDNNMEKAHLLPVAPIKLESDLAELDSD